MGRARQLEKLRFDPSCALVAKINDSFFENNFKYFSKQNSPPVFFLEKIRNKSKIKFFKLNHFSNFRASCKSEIFLHLFIFIIIFIFAADVFLMFVGAFL